MASHQIKIVTAASFATKLPKSAILLLPPACMEDKKQAMRLGSDRYCPLVQITVCFWTLAGRLTQFTISYSDQIPDGRKRKNCTCLARMKAFAWYKNIQSPERSTMRLKLTTVKTSASAYAAITV
jgi:hypothetical protein